MVLKIYIRVQKGVDIVAMGGKNEPIRYILFAFVVKSCNQEMYFIQQSNNNHYFLCTLQNTDIDIAMSGTIQQYMLMYTTNKVNHNT